MTLGGKLYLLKMPEHPIYASAGFVWPTITGNDATPRTLGNGIPKLTCNGNIRKQNPNDTTSNMGLQRTVQYYEKKTDWHTPTGNDALKEGAIECKPENGLSAQVRWASLTAQDSENNAGPSQFERNSQPLNAQVAKKPGEKLNPDWCEMLMGVPAGWTDPEAAMPELDAQAMMDTPWVAPPGTAQFEHEPPRTTGRKTHRKDRIKALGNGVVVQDVIPIALAIREFLDND